MAWTGEPFPTADTVAANGALPVLAPEVDQDDQVTKAGAILSSDAAVAVGAGRGRPGRTGVDMKSATERAYPHTDQRQPNRNNTQAANGLTSR